MTPPAGAVGPRLRAAGVFVLAFGSGFGVMTIEVAGARVMAPVFGLSAVPWTAVIGVILASLAVGNHLGGRLADEGRVPLAGVLAFAGVTAAIPVVLGGVPWWAARALGFVGGAVASAAVLFALPVLALGAVVPYLVRASTTSVDTVGRRAGDVSAAATVGSIAGTFATGFVLLPLLPLPWLLAGTAAALLLLAALAAVVLRGGPRPAGLVVAALATGILGAAAPWPGAGVLHREETVHGSIMVTETERSSGLVVREMWQNGGASSAEDAATGRPAHPYATTSLEALASLPDAPGSVLVLGGGALTLPVAVAGSRPGTTVDVVELDPAATRLARRFFAYGRAERPSIRVHHADGRRWLEDASGTWDVVYLDVFDNLVGVPWTMVTAEAFTAMRERLAPGGVLMANVLSPLEGDGSAFLRRLLATAGSAFPAVRAWVVVPSLDPGATQNVLLVAAEEAAHLPDLDRPDVGLEPDGPPLTDAHAPVEFLQARVFLEGLRWN